MILEYEVAHLLAILMRKHPQTFSHEFLSIAKYNLQKSLRVTNLSKINNL